MKWELAIIAGTVLAVAGVSRRLTGTPVTPAMVFVLIGVLVGPLMIDEVTSAPTGEGVKTLAEATLAVVLFADASRIKARVLRREYAVPLRLLGIGLPLTIALGAVLAAVIFDQLNATEAIVLAILLAPTDAALGEAVVTEPRLPSRIRQGLNVESGLNDGICVPLLLIALAAADVEDKSTSGHHALSIVAEQIGYGILGGVAAGLAAAAAVAFAYRRDLISGSWLQVIPVAAAGLAYGIAAALGGSGFIAAFVAGAIFGAPSSAQTRELADRPLRGTQPDTGPHAARGDRDDPHRRPGANRQLPRLVRTARSRIDRVRRDRRRGGPPARRGHDPGHHICDDRPVGDRTRNHRSAARPALRPLVRITRARPPPGDGVRPRTRPPDTRGASPRTPRAGMSTAPADGLPEPPVFRLEVPSCCVTTAATSDAKRPFI